MQDSNNNDLNSLLIRDFLREKRADRRWRIIKFLFLFALFVYIIVGVFSLCSGSSNTVNLGLPNQRYVSLLRLNGMIAPEKEFSAEEVLPLLHKAFSDKHSVGVILDIDSPGGTPVQAAIIHDAILTYKKLYHKKVIAVGEDMLTSGAYFVAVAADKIYVNPNSLTGSVGVIMKGFGFVDAIKKLGIERRVYTAGNSKDRLDPFLPQNPDDIAKILEVETEIHQNFMQVVMEGRKGKLQGDPAAIFNGDFWSGQGAKKLGLIDDLGNLMDAMNKEFNTMKYMDYTNNTFDFFRSMGNQFSNALDNVVFRLVA